MRPNFGAKYLVDRKLPELMSGGNITAAAVCVPASMALHFLMFIMVHSPVICINKDESMFLGERILRERVEQFC